MNNEVLFELNFLKIILFEKKFLFEFEKLENI